MKKTIKILIAACLGALIIVACSKSDDSDPRDSLVINSVSPLVGDVGTQVTLLARALKVRQ